MVKVTSPQGGTLTSASSHNISWTIHGTPSPVPAVKMSYRCGTEKWKLINYYAPNLSYSWHVPAVTNTKTDCVVKVDVLNQALTPIASDKSDNKFTINPAP